MNVLISNPGFRNKGDHLMIINTLDRIKAKYPESKFYVANNFKNDMYVKKYGIGNIYSYHKHRKTYYHKFLRTYGKLLDMLMPNTSKSISVTDIDIIIDTSGYYVADHWNIETVNGISRLYGEYKNKGKKIILLPKAYGPITNNKLIHYTNRLIDNVDILFARDQISYNELIRIGCNEDKIYKSPDFTILVDPKKIQDDQFDNEYVVIVPNIKMLTKFTEDQYLNFLRSIYSFVNYKYNVFFVIHSSGDMELARKVKKGIKIIEEKDPQILKAIINKAKYVVGSRYHSLISSLSQNVPAIGTSWSHKYEQLYEEYDISKFLVDISNKDDYQQKLSLLNEGLCHSKIVKKLKTKNINRKREAELMWERIYDVIES